MLDLDAEYLRSSESAILSEGVCPLCLVDSIHHSGDNRWHCSGCGQSYELVPDPYAIYATHLLMEECATPGCVVECPHTEYDCETIPEDDIWRDEPWDEYWGRSICRGYLPMWSWLHWRFEWLPSDALMSEWIERCEIG